MSAWATTIISGLVLLVAFMQWRTAHQKVVLDLFERRLKVYNDVNEAVSYFISTQGDMVSLNARMRLQVSFTESRFLFGEEVSSAIYDVSEDIRNLTWLVRKKDSDTITPSEHTLVINEILVIDQRIETFRGPFTELCLPYIRMNEKRVRTPIEFLRDKNKKRLSYAEPQK